MELLMALKTAPKKNFASVELRRNLCCASDANDKFADSHKISHQKATDLSSIEVLKELTPAVLNFV